MTKKFIVSFSDIRYQHVLERFEEQAKAMEVYDQIITLNEFDLDEEFRSEFQHKMQPKITRGYGFWCWKPQVILQAFDKMEEGDLMQYTDTGCHLNPNGKTRLLEYFESAENDEKGMLIFRAVRPLPPLDDGRSLPTWTESMWCKGDVLDYFNVRNNRDICDTPVTGAGIMFLRKNKFTVDFVTQWLKIIKENFNLIDDSPSISPNTENFVNHRHDQSLFSILCKLNKIDNYISAFEYSYPKNYDPNYRKYISDWAALDNYPILAMRDIKKINTR
jgi:hypothetical protein